MPLPASTRDPGREHADGSGIGIAKRMGEERIVAGLLEHQVYDRAGARRDVLRLNAAQMVGWIAVHVHIA